MWGGGQSLVALPKCVVHKVNNSADFDKHSINGLAVEVQSLEERVDTIEKAVHAGNLSLQQASEVLSCLCRNSTLISCGTSPRSCPKRFRDVNKLSSLTAFPAPL